MTDTAKIYGLICVNVILLGVATMLIVVFNKKQIELNATRVDLIECYLRAADRGEEDPE